MFVSKSRYNAAIRLGAQYLMELRSLRRKWNDLVDQINQKGGEDFLKRATIGGKQQFSQDDIFNLIKLCHPDKHGNSELANEMTKKLFAMRVK